MPTSSLREVPPRRIVLLREDERSDVRLVLAEFSGADVDAADFGTLLDQHAEQHAGKWVAVEWQGGLGWKRYLSCRR